MPDPIVNIQDAIKALVRRVIGTLSKQANRIGYQFAAVLLIDSQIESFKLRRSDTQGNESHDIDLTDNRKRIVVGDNYAVAKPDDIGNELFPVS